MSNYYIGQNPENSLGDSPRYFYAIRRGDNGQMYLRRVDNLKDKDSVDVNLPGDPAETFEDFEPGIDYFEGINADHEQVYANMFYPQYKWDNRSILYYIDDEGMLVQRINQNYDYPTGISE